MRYLNYVCNIYHVNYRNSTTNAPEIAGKAFLVKNIPGVQLYSNTKDESSVENMYIVLIDPTKRYLTVLKKTMIPFW